jgi:NAD(P)-dependent dehydrogenase (short-subunit alcohol dehydrogenase family)
MDTKVVLITGASSGNGYATAKLLLAKGYTVYATARSMDSMKPLENLGATVDYLDVTDQRSIDQCVERIIEKEGKIDIVLANAGYGCTGPIECVTIDAAKKQFDVNVHGVVRTIKPILPYMRQQGFGKIIIMSSGVGKISPPIMSWYSISKHAVEGLTDSLRMEVEQFGIDVIKIRPGFINTNFTQPAFHWLDQSKQSSQAEHYEEAIEKFRNNFDKLINEKGSDPKSVAMTVLKAIRSQHPKRTYTPTLESKMIVFLKRYVGDWLVDKILKYVFIK